MKILPLTNTNYASISYFSVQKPISLEKVSFGRRKSDIDEIRDYCLRKKEYNSGNIENFRKLIKSAPNESLFLIKSLEKEKTSGFQNHLYLNYMDNLLEIIDSSKAENKKISIGNLANLISLNINQYNKTELENFEKLIRSKDFENEVFDSFNYAIKSCNKKYMHLLLKNHKFHRNTYDSQGYLDEMREEMLKNFWKLPSSEQKSEINRLLNNGLITPKDIIQRNNCGNSLISAIAAITPEKQSKIIVKSLKNLGYLFFDEELEIAALKSAGLGNTELLKFFKEKHVNLKYCLAGKEDFSNEIQKILADVKIQDEKIFELLKMRDKNEISAFLKENSHIDINTRNKSGNTPILEAAKQGNIALLRNLKSLCNDIDWDVTDSFGKNILMQAIDTHDSEKICEVIDLIKSLPKGAFNVNYINNCCDCNQSSPYTALTYAIRKNKTKVDDFVIEKMLDELKELNPSVHAPCVMNAIHDCWAYSFREKIFRKLLVDSGIDVNEKINGKTLMDKLMQSSKGWSINICDSVKYGKIISAYSDSGILKSMKRIYEQNGTFTLDEIYDFVTHKDFNILKNESFNIKGEKIAHFLPECKFSQANSSQIEKLKIIFHLLKENDYNIDALDNLGDSALKKAVESKNLVVTKMLLEYGSLPKDMPAVIKTALQSDNNELKYIVGSFI